MKKVGFGEVIRDELAKLFGEELADEILDRSDLVKYLVHKTRSADRGSKARGSFANLYAIYVLVEDYVAQGFLESGDYKSYSGAQFSALFERQRKLPFGDKLQNHGFDRRGNGEFGKYF